MNSANDCTGELECDATQEVKAAKPIEEAYGSRGVARSEKSLREHSAKYKIIYKNKMINDKSFLPEPIN